MTVPKVILAFLRSLGQIGGPSVCVCVSVCVCGCVCVSLIQCVCVCVSVWVSKFAVAVLRCL